MKTEKQVIVYRPVFNDGVPRDVSESERGVKLLLWVLFAGFVVAPVLITVAFYLSDVEHIGHYIGTGLIGLCGIYAARYLWMKAKKN